MLSTALKASPSIVPTRFGTNVLVWAAWLYYEEKLTQEEIARIMGVSRASVVAFLQRAREEGIVSIAVAPRQLQSLRISQALSEKFGIPECLVLPDDGGHLIGFERAGQAGARLLAERIRPGDVLGVAWGRTILALSESMPAMNMPSVSVVQITGSAVGTYAFSAEFCVSNIANRIKGRCIHLHAPGIVSSAAVKEMLMGERALIEQFRIMNTCNRLVFGVGNPKFPNTIFDSAFITEDEAKPYLKRGAVAFLAGRFLDAAGNVVHGSLDDRMIGMTVPDLGKIPERICIAAGEDKVEPLIAVLRGGHVTTLITTEQTARGILRGDTLPH
jgi:DNA-binding transcriptional regulator LsrR (DeoR family)